MFQGSKEADANALLRLLCPSGILFSACYAADADGLIRFVFPTERLPTHTQVSVVQQRLFLWIWASVLVFSLRADHVLIWATSCFSAAVQMMLAAAAGRTELEHWPQYAGTLVYDSAGKPHVHLGVFSYFVFWTAFYVLKGGDGGGMDAVIRSRGTGLSDSVRKVSMQQAFQL